MSGFPGQQQRAPGGFSSGASSGYRAQPIPQQQQPMYAAMPTQTGNQPMTARQQQQMQMQQMQQQQMYAQQMQQQQMYAQQPQYAPQYAQQPQYAAQQPQYAQAVQQPQYVQAVPVAPPRHEPVPVMVDTTGDGVANAVGYDTNGDGKIDSIDYDGDGVIDAVVPGTRVNAVQQQQAPPPAYDAPPPAYGGPPPAYQTPSAPAQAPPAQAPVYKPSGPPAQVPPAAGQPQTLDFRSQDQKNIAANPNAVAVKGQNGLLHAGKAAPQQGLTQGQKNADTAAAVVGTTVAVGAIGAGAAVAVTNPGVIDAAASGVGHLAAGAASAIGNFFS